ncbi:hypothetical protein ACNF42_05455 [Cuniculiplasma sp. SKW3]
MEPLLNKAKTMNDKYQDDQSDDCMKESLMLLVTRSKIWEDNIFKIFLND